MAVMPPTTLTPTLPLVEADGAGRSTRTTLAISAAAARQLSRADSSVGARNSRSRPHSSRASHTPLVHSRHRERTRVVGRDAEGGREAVEESTACKTAALTAG